MGDQVSSKLAPSNHHLCRRFVATRYIRDGDNKKREENMTEHGIRYEDSKFQKSSWKTVSFVYNDTAVVKHRSVAEHTTPAPSSDRRPEVSAGSSDNA